MTIIFFYAFLYVKTMVLCQNGNLDNSTANCEIFPFCFIIEAWGNGIEARILPKIVYAGPLTHEKQLTT